MTTTITATDFAKHAADILRRVHERGEEFIIERDGEQIARLSPSVPLGITAQEMVRRLGDMPMPGDGFADDLEAARSSATPVEPPPWPCQWVACVHHAVISGHL